MTSEEQIELLRLQNKNLNEQINSLVKVLVGLKDSTLKIEDIDIRGGNDASNS